MCLIFTTCDWCWNNLALTVVADMRRLQVSVSNKPRAGTEARAARKLQEIHRERGITLKVTVIGLVDGSGGLGTLACGSSRYLDKAVRGLVTVRLKVGTDALEGPTDVRWSVISS